MASGSSELAGCGGSARSVYFLKANPIPDDGTGPQAIPFAFAETVRRFEGRLQAVNIQVPICAGGRDGLKTEGFGLNDRGFAGYAYRVRAPGWFKFGRKDDPDRIDGGDRARAVARILHTTPLGVMCRHPEIRMALAQDRLAETLNPLLAAPDLIAGEDRLLRDWEVERPGPAAHAAASAKGLAAASPGLPPPTLRMRLAIRLAALRRIDAAAVGREVFSPCPAFFGEPHIAFDLGCSLNFKAGMVRISNSWPNPGTETRSLAWRSDPLLVEAVENRLFPPLASSGQSAAELAGVIAEWTALGPLREFEMSSPLPLFPRTTIYPNGHLPRGFRIRIGPETMIACGGSYLTLAAAGLSPYIAEPFAEYCRSRVGLLEEWSGDVAALVSSKWG
jgi:hypothetical protein